MVYRISYIVYSEESRNQKSNPYCVLREEEEGVRINLYRVNKIRIQR